MGFIFFIYLFFFLNLQDGKRTIFLLQFTYICPRLKGHKMTYLELRRMVFIESFDIEIEFRKRVTYLTNRHDLQDMQHTIMGRL